MQKSKGHLPEYNPISQPNVNGLKKYATLAPYLSEIEVPSK